MAKKRYASGGLGLILTALIGLSGWAGAFADESGEVERVREDPLAFTFRISPPPLGLERRPDGTETIRIPGFGVRSRRVGAPDIPEKSVLVAIPEGSEPRLVVRDVGSISWIPARPAPVPSRVLAGLADGEDPFDDRLPLDRAFELRRAATHERFDIDPELYSAAEPYPGELARLGARGRLRDQSYVEVFVAPVRFDAHQGLIEVHTELEITVHFDDAPGPSAVVPAESRFESVYRAAFANYEQGRGFRSEPIDGEMELGGALLAPGSIGPRLRLRVRQNGRMRLDHAAIVPTGFLDTLPPISRWRLTNRGIPVPLEIQDDGDDALEAGEWVQFYAQALDDEPKTLLEHDFPGTPIDVFAANDFTDENVYFLTVEATAQPAMPVRASAPTFTRPLATSFRDRSRVEVDDAYRPLGGADPWCWTPSQRLSPPAAATRTESVPLPGHVAGTGQPLTVRVELRSLSEDELANPDHRTRVSLKNGTQVLSSQDEQFDGRVVHAHQFDWSDPSGQLGTTANVTLELLATSTAASQVILDFIQLDYARSFASSGDALTFTWPNGDAEFQVTGLSGPSVAAYEITLPAGSSVVPAVRLAQGSISGAGPYALRFRVDLDPGLPAGAPRRFLVAGPAAAAVPAPGDLSADTVSDLRLNTHQADLIAIVHPSLLDGTSTPVIDQWLAHRASAAGGGLTSKLVRLDDIEDEFQNGLRGPTAIREFLRWVLSTAPGEGWANPKPSHVVLIGDGSIRYKDGIGAGDLVPTQVLFLDRPELGYYASDNMLAAVVGSDRIPDLFVGRLPVRTPAELVTVLNKILTYEQATPTGDWRRNAFFVSDRGKNYSLSEADTFETLNDDAAAEMPAPFQHHHLRYWTDYCDPQTNTCNRPAARQEIKDRVNGLAGPGASLLQYTGHGNFVVWSDDAIFDDRAGAEDTQDLVNGARLPWLMAHNCLTGGFHADAPGTIGENWLGRSGGGAIAAYAPSGLGFTFIGATVSDEMWESLFGPAKDRETGITVMKAAVALCGQGSVESCQHYVYLGDPALRLALPSVNPPTNPQATAGNAQVQLQWTASTSAGATYDVYRTTAPHLPYVKVNAAPIAGVSFLDTAATGIQNALEYFYYIVARDASGFESRWSNFNSDCAVDGPDCVNAEPLNPDPPGIPALTSVVDAELGGKINVGWVANGESDLSAYRIYYSTQPGCIPDPTCTPATRNVNKAFTADTLLGLVDGVTYYVSMTASNTSGHESAASVELSATPTLVQGMKSPALISNLRLGKSGSDVVLSWDPVTSDIYGKPLAVTSYEVFRGTTPTFVPAVSNRIGTTSNTTFSDPLALSGGAPNYHYLVRALDAAGRPGGLGRQLPDGISSLIEAKSATPGAVVLTWSPVTQVFRVGGGGGPTTIAHYAIYGSTTPFTRDAVRAGTIPLLATTPGTSIELPPAAGNGYYSVISVDSRGNESPY